MAGAESRAPTQGPTLEIYLHTIVNMVFLVCWRVNKVNVSCILIKFDIEIKTC